VNFGPQTAKMGPFFNPFKINIFFRTLISQGLKISQLVKRFYLHGRRIKIDWRNKVQRSGKYGAANSKRKIELLAMSMGLPTL